MDTDKKDNPRVTLGVTRFGDVGVYAKELIQEGERIASFDGAVYSWTDVTESIPNVPPVLARDHAIQFEEFRARDSNGLARYANHSCNPNTGIKNSFDLVAMREIEPGEEIVWDYAMTEDTYWSMNCRCGSSQCRKLIAGYRFLSPQKRLEYRNFISEWLISSQRPYLGEAVVNFALHRYPIPSEGNSFRYAVVDTDPENINVITEERILNILNQIEQKETAFLLTKNSDDAERSG